MALVDIGRQVIEAAYLFVRKKKKKEKKQYKNE